MVEPATNEYKIKINALWTATKRDAFLIALKQRYAENCTLAECAELIRAAMHDGLANGLRVVDMLPMADLTPKPAKPPRRQRPTSTHRPRARRNPEEQAALENAVFDRILGSRAPVTLTHLVRVLEPHFDRIGLELVRAVLRKLVQAGRVQRHPTQHNLWMHRPQGATAAAPMVVRRNATPPHQAKPTTPSTLPPARQM